MKDFKLNLFIVAVAVIVPLSAMAEPKYKADVPESITTPDSFKSKYAGNLKFIDGFPTDETVKNVYDYLDTARAVELFLNGLPTSSMYAMLNGHAEIGFKANKTVGITEQLMDARSLWLTPQTTTPYVHSEINVKEEPVVIELGSPVIGILDDAYFKYVADIGLGGQDKGKGGKYLLVGPDFKGDIPEGYFVLKTNTYRHWLLMRVVVKKDETLEQAIAKFKSGYKAYPLSQASNPEANEFINLSGKKHNTIHANDAHFYHELNEVIQYEPVTSGDPELLGLAASIGIKKGQPFKPDARMKQILDEAAAIANASSRAILFRPRNKAVYFYDDRQWFSPLAGGSHEFLHKGARVLDDRIAFHYYATGITPFMVKPRVGSGSVYEVGVTVKNGDPLDGSKVYSVTMPNPIPARNFWSFMVYDNHTRSILETDQASGGLDSNARGFKYNEDGSATVYFAPEAPKGKEGNWVQTMSGKGFNVLLRIYGPEQAWFDKTWKPGDFELME
jgi:hypothetical protein